MEILPQFLAITALRDLREGKLQETAAFSADRRKIISVNFVVRTHAFQQNGVSALVLHELEDNAQVIARTASPGSSQPAFQLMSLELWMKRIFGQQFER
jgi:hypothetical protein